MTARRDRRERCVDVQTRRLWVTVWLTWPIAVHIRRKEAR